MSIQFISVTSSEDIKALAEMAHEIWHEYWPCLLSVEQIDYMVEQFQTASAITTDIENNAYEYWFLEEDGRIVGYTGGRVEGETNRFFISKIYLYDTERGKGYASQVIAFYEALCKDRNLCAMYLTVNKENDLGIRAYRAKGFKTIEAKVTDIGQGFVMDDFIMEKPIANMPR